MENVETLRRALEESVKLQSHYAGLLNDYDGGERHVFANGDEWIDHVEFVGPRRSIPRLARCSAPSRGSRSKTP